MNTLQVLLLTLCIVSIFCIGFSIGMLVQLRRHIRWLEKMLKELDDIQKGGE